VGGLLNLIPNKNFFIIATEITLDLVLNRYDHVYGLENVLPKNFFYRIFPARYDCTYRFASGGALNFFYSSHYPGSAMILITFSNGKTLLYTGDFSISSVYGEGAKTQLLDPDSCLWQVIGGHLDWAVVDAALGSRVGEEPSFYKTGLLEKIDSVIHHNGSAVFFSEPQDCGLFLYFDLFARYLSGSRSYKFPIYVDPLVKRQLNTLDKYLKLKWIHALWPDLQKFVIKRVTPCESVWLFEMGGNWSVNFDRHRASERPTLFILDFDQAVKGNYGNVRAFSKIVSEADLICVIGKISGHAPLREVCARKLLRTSEANIKISGEILLLDETPWMPHCTRNELEEILRRNKSRIENVLLFHGRLDALDQLAKDVSKSINISIRGLPDYPIPF
jgi:Cft2 family RNA processing exonuclease